jgi:hypothetical protein
MPPKIRHAVARRPRRSRASRAETNRYSYTVYVSTAPYKLTAGQLSVNYQKPGILKSVRFQYVSPLPPTDTTPKGFTVSICDSVGNMVAVTPGLLSGTAVRAHTLRCPRGTDFGL